MATNSESSAYVLEQRRAYSLYVLQSRAIPAATDGLKAGGRRVLWTARDGKKHKSASLAGATMPIHPHASPEGAIDTLTAPYGNNIPLFKGDGAFGTLLKPTAYGASRYTSVTASKFTQDVMFRDLDIVPMTNNYDDTLVEPVHFLPLIPIALLNPAEGVAVGYATNILPRSLPDIINAQLAVLAGKKTLEDPMPNFTPLNSVAYEREEVEKGVAYYFMGSVDIKDTSTATITSLPYSQTHKSVISKLEALMDADVLLGYVDNSRDTINIQLKFRRGYLKFVDTPDLMRSLGLIVRQIENLNVVSFDGRSVWSTNFPTFVRAFTNWRLKWYSVRYQRLHDLLQHDIQRYLDIRTAIDNKVGGAASSYTNRTALRDYLTTLGIVHVDYIADLPVYRFTLDEYNKNEERLKAAEIQLAEYKDLLKSDAKRAKVYVSELQEILSKYHKGSYNE